MEAGREPAASLQTAGGILLWGAGTLLSPNCLPRTCLTTAFHKLLICNYIHLFVPACCGKYRHLLLSILPLISYAGETVSSMSLCGCQINIGGIIHTLSHGYALPHLSCLWLSRRPLWERSHPAVALYPKRGLFHSSNAGEWSRSVSRHRTPILCEKILNYIWKWYSRCPHFLLEKK